MKELTDKEKQQIIEICQKYCHGLLTKCEMEEQIHAICIS
jgi:hypothetical protein